jgi:hypothetical protein
LENALIVEKLPSMEQRQSLFLSHYREHLSGFVGGASFAVKKGGEDEELVSLGVFYPRDCGVGKCRGFFWRTWADSSKGKAVLITEKNPPGAPVKAGALHFL